MVTVSLIASLTGVGVLVFAGLVLIHRHFKYREKRRRKVSDLEQEPTTDCVEIS
jgi:hypothetical protein